VLPNEKAKNAFWARRMGSVIFKYLKSSCLSGFVVLEFSVFEKLFFDPWSGMGHFQKYVMD
jgi:hypothetical protein